MNRHKWLLARKLFLKMSNLSVPKRRKRSLSHRSESHPGSSIAGPSKVARNAYNVLPDPSAHKAKYTILKGNLESLKHIDISTFSSKKLSKLSEDDKLSCLILKYGFNVVCTCASGLTVGKKIYMTFYRALHDFL